MFTCVCYLYVHLSLSLSIYLQYLSIGNVCVQINPLQCSSVLQCYRTETSGCSSRDSWLALCKKLFVGELIYPWRQKTTKTDWNTPETLMRSTTLPTTPQPYDQPDDTSTSCTRCVRWNRRCLCFLFFCFFLFGLLNWINFLSWSGISHYWLIFYRHYWLVS